MSHIAYGGQTYPWQMNIEKFHGQVPHMVDTLVQAGFTGIEAEICMLEDYYTDWQRLKALLDEKGIVLAALAVHEPWLLPRETEEEYQAANQAIEFLTHFPAAKLMLGHAAEDPIREHNLREKQDNQMSCIRAIGQRAAERGIVSVFHPNPTPNSIFRYEEDYQIMFDALYQCEVGYAPDIGHMLNGNIDPLAVIKQHRDKVRHVHFKDMDASHVWAAMGKGIGDFKSIIDFLNDTDYLGWIIVEDESPDAVRDSDAVVLADGLYIKANR